MRSALVACCCAAIAAVSSAAVFAQETAGTRTAEPKVERIVVEDDYARIEELRIRGQTQRIVVRPKRGTSRPYEIVPADGARDLTDGPHASKGAAGQRVWNVLNF
jgi:hypothetical protein